MEDTTCILENTTEIVENTTDDNKNTTEKPKSEETKQALVRKNNELITAKYKASLLENQLSSICLSRIQEQNGSYIATVSAQELHSLLGFRNDNHRIYQKLLQTAKNMGGRMLVVEDPEKESFQIINLISKASYVDGIFSVKFNSELRPYFTQLKSGYTTYALANILNFKFDYSFRIYELIRKEAYKVTEQCPYVVVTYNLNEFRVTIGMCSTDSDKVKKELQKTVVDWDKVVDVSPEKSYMSWSEFRRNVLIKAQKEINSQCDYGFTFEPIRSGRGGKVREIKLTIFKNDVSQKLINQTKDEIDSFNEQLSLWQPSPDLLKYIHHNNLTKKNISTLLDEAGGDNDLVIRAIEAADKEPYLRNYVGWIRSYVRNGGYQKTETIRGSKEQAKVVREVMEGAHEQRESLSANFWQRTKSHNGAKYREFVKFLEEQGLTVELFEGACSESECGEKYIEWTRGELKILL